jgi:hypothetical protein
MSEEWIHRIIPHPFKESRAEIETIRVANEKL